MWATKTRWATQTSWAVQRELPLHLHLSHARPQGLQKGPCYARSKPPLPSIGPQSAGDFALSEQLATILGILLGTCRHILDFRSRYRCCGAAPAETLASSKADRAIEVAVPQLMRIPLSGYALQLMLLPRRFRVRFRVYRTDVSAA